MNDEPLVSSVGAEIFHFAACSRCDWCGPIRDTELDADQDAINHELDHHTDDQHEIDIGDDMYERSRYDEHDIDVEPGREDRWKPERPI
jgi:hypothetical protein